MFIQTETTPNPLTLKFIPGVEIMKSGTAFYTSPEAAAPSPLAKKLFGVKDVAAVFLGGDFITVTKNEKSDWDVLKPTVLAAIMDHLVAGLPVLSEATKSADTSGDTEIEKQIRELIDTRVRPAVAQDGGDIVFCGFENGIVKLEMHGACSGCPSSTATLKQGVENMLKHYVPEVVAVEAV